MKNREQFLHGVISVTKAWSSSTVGSSGDFVLVIIDTARLIDAGSGGGSSSISSDDPTYPLFCLTVVGPRRIRLN